MAKVQCDNLGCECACHRVRQRQVPRLWTPAMQQAVRDAVARGEHPRTIAARLHLTEDSIRWAARKLDLSFRDGWYSRQEVTVLLGVSWRSVKRWQSNGYLRVGMHGTRWTRVTDADLRTFVQQYAGVEFRPTDVKDPVLRRLAETSAITNQRRTARQAG